MQLHALRYRLTIIYALAALCIFGLIFFIGHQVLSGSFEDFVTRDQQRIGARVTQTLSVLLEMGEKPDMIERILRSNLRGRIHCIRLLDANGQTVFFLSRPLPSNRVRPVDRAGMPDRHQTRRDRRWRDNPARRPPDMRWRPPAPQDGPPLRLQQLDFPVRLPGGDTGTLRIGFHIWSRMIDSVEQFFLNRMRAIFILSALAAILGFAVLAFLIARTLARPLERVAAAARRIEAGALEARVVEEGVLEIRDLAGTFNRMATALGEKESLQQRMSSDVAHELRTPVTILKSHLEAISEGVMEMDGAAAASLLEETNRLERIINDLRTIWELEKGAGEVRLETINLSTLLREMGDRIGKVAAQQQSTLTLELEPGISLVTDRERLARAANNILINAVKHSGRGGAIRLSLRQRGGEIRIAVADNGPGIPKEALGRVFERFYRTDDSRNRESGGAGLGLAIASEAVRGLGGRIEAHNNDGPGCTFTITLPGESQKGAL